MRQGRGTQVFKRSVKCRRDFFRTPHALIKLGKVAVGHGKLVLRIVAAGNDRKCFFEIALGGFKFTDIGVGKSHVVIQATEAVVERVER